MKGYVGQVLDEVPSDMRGTASTPAENHLYNTSIELPALDQDQAESYHHITAQLLYLCRHAQPDIQTAMAFLCTRVSAPTEQDWKKLSRCVQYLRGTKELPLILEDDNGFNVKWWIDASFVVHPNMQSQTGMTMSLGKGFLYSGSVKQKISSCSSTEAKLISVNNAMSLVVWTQNFLMAQGHHVDDNVIFQDNQSVIMLESNGKASSGRWTCHLDICTSLSLTK